MKLNIRFNIPEVPVGMSQDPKEDKYAVWEILQSIKCAYKI